MNTNFILIDKNNNLQKNATAIVKFNFENKDYIIYSIPENEENSQVLTSKIILNSEGKYFIEDITVDEKSKLSNIIYNMVILIPTDAKKGANTKELIENFKNKYAINLSTEIPELMNQDYFSNCSIAITNKSLIEEAIKFYKENLIEEEQKVEENTVLTWTLPVEATNNMIEENSTLPIEPIVPVINPMEEQKSAEPEITTSDPITEVVGEANIEIPSTPVVEETKQAVIPDTIPEINNITPSMPSNEISEPSEVNPQMAIVSDPSINDAIGTNMQPNVMKSRKAGFAINKYVIIGTLCILASIAVVVIAWILIQNKTTGV